MDFPPTFVINLDERKDRLKSLHESFDSVWPVNIERISAIKEKPGWKGCLKSHKKALELCKEKNVPFVIILEDDCMLTPSGVQRFQQLLPSLIKRASEWDVFLGGVTYLDKIELKQYNPPLFQVKCFAAHFCLYNQKGIRTLLENWSDKEPYDVFLKNTVRLWCTVPHIAVQRAGTSDIQNDSVDYEKFFLESHKLLQKSIVLNGVEGFQSSKFIPEDILEEYLIECKRRFTCIVLIDTVVLVSLFLIWKISR